VAVRKHFVKRESLKKKTRQGHGRGTKYGHKSSKRHYIKKSRGQGSPKR